MHLLLLPLLAFAAPGFVEIRRKNIVRGGYLPFDRGRSSITVVNIAIIVAIRCICRRIGSGRGSNNGTFLLGLMLLELALK